MNDFWAKTTPDNLPGISVFDHMINVGCVARSIAKNLQELIDAFRLEPSVIGALAALHDLGKISPGFQMKCEEWLKKKGLQKIAQNGCWDTAMEADHGKTTHSALQDYFNTKTSERTATFLPAVLGGHHGRLNRPNERGYKPEKLIVDKCSGIDWEGERRNAADAVLKYFGVSLSNLSVDDSNPALWWLAGLTSVADWIGSDERYFPPTGGPNVTDASKVAERCLQEIGFKRPEIIAGLSFYDIFGFESNRMQSAALSTITDQGVYVVEAPMGMGKTEAALGAAYQLLVSGKANGIYFALPTQSTSNRMHLRMEKFVKRISPNGIETKIIHGNSWLMDKIPAISPVRTTHQKEESAELGRNWFSSAKRALISPFGVGTVDQALLGVVAAKHFFVRHFALAGKVVILDEIHSYDIYTGTLIDQLIKTLEQLKCTVMVLSATLSKTRRSQIVSDDKNKNVSPAKEPYPLITGRRQGTALNPHVVLSPEQRTVEINFTANDQAIPLAIDAAKKGACVVWVCDTIDSAQRIFQSVRGRSKVTFPTGLLHARFPFWRREELEGEWMERLGKDSSKRCGSILVSTQVVEQSVDIDADIMITELAPTDMLLQRLGRLCRHERGKRNPVLHIIEEDKSLAEFRKLKKTEIEETLGAKAKVYHPYVLLRSLVEWKKLKKLTIPNDVRKLLEATYAESKKEPIAWGELFNIIEGKKISLRQVAITSSNLWQVPLNDEEGVQTRINELPMLSLLLCSRLSQSSAEFINGENTALGHKNFNLQTAQAIHRNIIRIHQYLFDKTESHPSIEPYVRGNYTIGLLESNGTVSVKGLKNGFSLRWENDLGLVIDKRS